MPRGTTVLLFLALLVPACGPDAAVPEVDVPAWAHVAPEQIAEAKKHGVPVAFENDLGMRFVLIPAGTFLMGSPEDEEGRDPDSEGQREVRIARPFYMSIYEVRNADFDAFDAEHKSRMVYGLSLEGETQPAVDVPWRRSVAFSMWVSRADSRREYRLPTEAEWERACRAGAKSRFSWGDDAALGWRYANAIEPDTAALAGFDVAGWSRDDGHRVTAPVGSYMPNPWGLYDMHGNAWEFCLNAHGERPSTIAEWQDSDGEARVIRGGSYAVVPQAVRCAYRYGVPAGAHSPDVGFRLVSPLPEPGK